MGNEKNSCFSHCPGVFAFFLNYPLFQTIIFNIRTPTSPCFFVKPHVGMIDPGGKATLYFTFKGRCHRVPSDYCWIYSIYQLVVDEKTTAFIKEDEFSSQNLRSAWIKHGRKQVNNILHLASSFKAGKPKFECRDGHRKFLERKIYLNDLGDVGKFIFNTVKGQRQFWKLFQRIPESQKPKTPPISHRPIWKRENWIKPRQVTHWMIYQRLRTSQLFLVQFD